MLFSQFLKSDTVKFALNIAAYLALLEVMVSTPVPTINSCLQVAQVQSYYRRQVYTIVYLTATAWPLLNGTDFVKTNIFLCTTWALSCAAMSVFTLLPANKLEDITLMYVGPIQHIVLELTLSQFCQWHPNPSSWLFVYCV